MTIAAFKLERRITKYSIYSMIQSFFLKTKTAWSKDISQLFLDEIETKSRRSVHESV